MIGQTQAVFDNALDACPVIAILRGATPDEVVAVGEALHAAGLRILEVPLNSPDPFESIRRLKRHFGERMVVGAGTVLTPQHAQALVQAGGEICVSPNTDVEVIDAALKIGLLPIPGIATPTEAFLAIRAGASVLKLFPADVLGTAMVKALAAVLPTHVRVLAVGGIGIANAGEFLRAGCAGLAVGSELYVAGRTAENVHARARSLVTAVEQARGGLIGF